MAQTKTRRWRRAAAGALSALLALAAPAQASAPPDCAALAAEVGRAAGLPEGLLPTISLVEAGKRWPDGSVKGWPWAINHAGKGMYFDTRAEALAYVRKAVAGGARNIDIGCMQINLRWHGQAFDTVEQMIDPAFNIPYAARFLTELYHQHGSWETAIKHYHSANPEFNVAYLDRVKRNWPGAAASIGQAGAPSADGLRLAAASAAAPRDARGLVPVGWQPGLGLWANDGAPGAAGPLVHLGQTGQRPELVARGRSGFDRLVATVPGAGVGDIGYRAPVVPATRASVSPTLSRQWHKIERMRALLAGG